MGVLEGCEVRTGDKLKIEVRFSPNGGCQELIINSIKKSKRKILVQAFQLTSKEISDALIDAYNRGIEVRIIIDKRQQKAKYSQYKKIKESGIEIIIDKVKGYSHNKIIIIDSKLVITGSYNYSDNAEYRNSENILQINKRSLANKYEKNWYLRFKNAA